MKFAKFLALFGAVAAFAACEPTPGPGPEPSTEGKIVLSADKTTIALGESVTFKVEQTDKTTGEVVDVTAYAELFDGDLNTISNPFTPTASGYYNISATYGAEAAKSITISVLAKMPEIPSDPDPSCLDFNHRVVLIDHTGVNCGYCPYATDNLIDLAKDSKWHSHYNEVTCHAGDFAGSDPAACQAANALNAFQGPRGYPTIMINFYNKCTDYLKSSIIAVLTKTVKMDGADAGIAMAVEGDATNIYCAAQIKSKVEKEYKVVAWLLESGIYSPNQSNAFKEEHKIYNFAIRNISGKYSNSNVSGESVGVIEAGKTLDCAFQLPITSTKWNWENMGVLVIVSAKDAQGRWDVVNSAYCSLADKSKTYEYFD